MQAQEIGHMFHFKYLKPAGEIVEKATKKRSAVQAKIEERQRRVADLRKEYEIDDAAYIQLLEAARGQQRTKAPSTYTFSKSSAPSNEGARMEEKVIGAGVVNNLLTESDFITSEREQIKTLDLMIRNLKPLPRFAANGAPLPDEEFQLSTEELTYLGF